MPSMYRTASLLLALAGVSVAQPSGNISICDKYTTALFHQNTGANQYKLLTYLVNMVVIGSYNNSHAAAPNVKVPGILAPGEFNGTKVNLLPYFDGGLNSTNRGGGSDAGVAVNFLDGGGAKPVMANKPANSDGSAQSKLLTHLYSYFGILLGCSQSGKDGLPAYDGAKSQYDVHKYMGLDAYQIGYFIAQVGLAASSFGVSGEDVVAVADALSGAFNVKCAPATTIDPAQGAELQSICVADSCPQAPGGDCAPYGTSSGEPLVANATLALGEGKNGTGSKASTSAADGKNAGVTGPKPTGTGTGAGTGKSKSSSGATLLDADMWLGVLVGAALLCIFSW